MKSIQITLDFVLSVAQIWWMMAVVQTKNLHVLSQQQVNVDSKRNLKLYDLKRKNVTNDEDSIISAIQCELDGPSCVAGYRSLWHTLRIKYGLILSRNKVQHLLKALDPEGAEERQRRKLKRRTYSSHGPNDCWHVDGYDKLKPFGFPIHGAIDGYSRRVLWLVVGRSNNDPRIVATYYNNCVKELEGCPVLLRTDPGTENGIIASMQCVLRGNEDAHRYGPS